MSGEPIPAPVGRSMPIGDRPSPAGPSPLRSPPSRGRREVSPEAMARLRGVVDRTRPLNLATERLLPLTGATEHLLPGGGLARGSVVAVSGGSGATTLALALAAGPCRTGSWVACVGFPQLGWEAVEEVGLPLDRLVAVHTPPRQWTGVVAALLDAFEVVLCGPEVIPTAAELRNLKARARERESVVVGVAGVATSPGGVAGGRSRRWPPGDVRLRVERCRWQGLGQGWGRLGRRRLDVVVEGRGELTRPRREQVLIDARGRPVAPDDRQRVEGREPPSTLLGAPAAPSSLTAARGTHSEPGGTLGQAG